MTNSMYSKFGKRICDITISCLGLVFLGPLLGIIALIVRLKLGPPVLFRQQRPGLNGHPFIIYKFRSMSEARDEHGNLLPDGKRLTAFGRFLRASSMDELPELWNILRGEMSIVGPRPLLMEYLPRYSPEQARRHEVRPGITGWAQINGRNALTWDERFALDVWYVDNLSFWLDLKIFLLTFHKIIKRDGITKHGHATMSKFTGRTDNG